jgi:hypothetical protein
MTSFGLVGRNSEAYCATAPQNGGLRFANPPYAFEPDLTAEGLR